MAKRAGGDLPTRVGSLALADETELVGVGGDLPPRGGSLAVGTDLIGLMPKHLGDYVARGLSLASAPVSDAESLWRLSDLGDRMEMAGRLLAGKANLELAQRIEPRMLAEELRRRGKPRANFDYQAKVCLAFEALPDSEKVEALGALGFSKAKATLQWSQEERLALASGEKVRGVTLDDAASMPSREFEQTTKADNGEVAKLQDQVRKWRTKADTLDAELQAQQKGHPNLTKADLRRRKQKLLAHGLTEISQRAANEAAKLLSELCDPAFMPNSRDEALADKAICTGVLLEFTNGLAAWSELVATARESLGGRVSADPDDVPVMTPNECFEARRRRAAMAEFTRAEADAASALSYAQDAMAGEVEPGAPPKALRKLRKGKAKE